MHSGPMVQASPSERLMPPMHVMLVASHLRVERQTASPLPHMSPRPRPGVMPLPGGLLLLQDTASTAHDSSRERMHESLLQLPQVVWAPPMSAGTVSVVVPVYNEIN